MTDIPFFRRVTALVHMNPPSIHSGGRGNELVTMRTVISLLSCLTEVISLFYLFSSPGGWMGFALRCGRVGVRLNIELFDRKRACHPGVRRLVVKEMGGY